MPRKKNSVKNKSYHIYKFTDEYGMPLYVGKTRNLQPRIQRHLRQP
jgi:excinuclease UvrABC nuclease subunit